MSSGGLHKPVDAGEYKGGFYQSLRAYDSQRAVQMRKGRSLSPKDKKDPFMMSMTTFSKKYVNEMKAMQAYQQEMDKRLSQPRYTKSTLKK